MVAPRWHKSPSGAEGMPITSLQHLLGHERLDTTLIYARVHSETVRQGYEWANARLSPETSLGATLFDASIQIAEPPQAILVQPPSRGRLRRRKTGLGANEEDSYGIELTLEGGKETQE